MPQALDELRGIVLINTKMHTAIIVTLSKYPRQMVQIDGLQSEFRYTYLKIILPNLKIRIFWYNSGFFKKSKNLSILGSSFLRNNWMYDFI